MVTQLQISSTHLTTEQPGAEKQTATQQISAQELSFQWSH